MRWREAAWLVLATGALIALIVSTVHREVDAARERFAKDTLHFLAGHLALAMDRAAGRGEDPRAWKFPLLGPGEAWPGADDATGSPLAAVLPHTAFVPADPWGRRFAVILTGNPSAPYPLLVCAGPAGLTLGAEPADRHWTEPILWPSAPPASPN
jgi:hypothetical protein